MMQGNMIKKAKELQDKMKQILETVKGEATSGGGMVTAIADGNGTILELNIEQEVVNPEEKDMLEDLVLAAVNEAQRKAKETAQQEIQKVIGMPLPGMF